MPANSSTEPIGGVTYRLLPDPSPHSLAFWSGGEFGELRIYRCAACARLFHPPAPACFRCRSLDVAPHVVSGRARVAAFTVNHHPWFEGFPPPYVVAIVELEDDPTVRLTTNIVDCPLDDLRVGLDVEACFERWDDVWLPLFAPRTS